MGARNLLKLDATLPRVYETSGDKIREGSIPTNVRVERISESTRKMEISGARFGMDNWQRVSPGYKL